MSRRFLLHASRIHDLADRHHLTQSEIADKLVDAGRLSSVELDAVAGVIQ